MELNYLREFVALAQSCQFQETADRLFMSQSSLSKHIKAIEKELGAELLNRSTRRVELSEFGRAFLPYAQQISQLQEDYTLALLPEVRENGRRVTIGVIPLVTFYWLKGFMSQFSLKYPDYSVEFVERGDNQLREMLRRGECDLIIACESPDGADEEFRSAPYARDRLVAVMPDDHPLARHEAVFEKDLVHYPLIHLGSTNMTRHLAPEIQTASYVASRGNMLVEMVLKDMGIGILTYHAFLHFQAPGVCFVDLCPPLRVNLNLLYPKKKRKNAIVVSGILEYMRTKEKDKGLIP